ncbi:hypothetical protein NQZ79_g5148 [Umbelopsis isabellina]|nr:hypothetical protein NQZ79_g5148 [Umbelopsis isabellina]
MALHNVRDYLRQRRATILSYLKDWILVIIFLVIFLAIDFLPPFHQEFYVDDWSIRYPYSATERVNLTALMIIAIVAPFVIICLIAGAIKRSFHDLHNGVLGLFFALTFTLMFTDVLKITIGEPRPDMLARCQPAPNTQSPAEALLNISICTTPYDSTFQDGFKSFPSGHSSFSFAGLGYLSLYLCGKLHVFDHKGHVWKGFVVLIPIMGAILVAISRIMDYRHHPWDVVFGGLLGFLAAYFSYHQYYPPLHANDCHLPFEPRHHVKFVSRPEDETQNAETTQNQE